jgi:hypothetical protein
MTLLAGRSDVGDGELHPRAFRDLQRKHFKPPG